MLFRLLLIAALSCPTLAHAADTVRPTHYLPDGQAIVCHDGSARFTRALYGGPTAWRLETSDRPVFATYSKPGSHRHIAMRLLVGTTSVALDSTTHCEARYLGGRRDYLLTDRRWNGATLRISVLADPDREGAVWQIRADGFGQTASLEAINTPTVRQRFKRVGDIGSFEKAGGFEADTKSTDRITISLPLADGQEAWLAIDSTVLHTDTPTLLADRFARAEEARQALTSRISISTPDPYFNPFGALLATAADGAWDGDTWLHGAVGWRTQIPGWRAAYVGDMLGWADRQRSHFTAYAESQVTDVPVTKGHLMDESNNLARGTYEWGTPMYSNGYICRQPHNNSKFHHYDMNLVYIDELLWHLQWDADTAFMRRMWPVLQRHLAWEKQAWDPDGDHLYDAYCCIWASDALQYNGGAVTHSSAYNYRANLLAARIATLLGEDATPYRQEADAILAALNSRLWLSDRGHWAEFQDLMGNRLVHNDAALWTIYTAIDCDAATPQQAWQAMRYVDRQIPHIPYIYNGEQFYTVSTSRWAPYEWSINNVAMAEVSHTALAYYEAGRPEEATRLLRGNLVDFMYAGSSPGNFGQLSTLDRNTGEGYRDFSDVTGITARALVQGLYGIQPQALSGQCIIRPGMPASWDSASIRTPYIYYSMQRQGGKTVYTIRQNFAQPLRIVLRQNLGEGRYRDIAGTCAKEQTIEVETVATAEPQADLAITTARPDTLQAIASRCEHVDLSKLLNDSVGNIFQPGKYRSPRAPYTTLALPTQGIGDWCSTKRMFTVDDSGLRALARKGNGTLRFADSQLPTFRSPAEGRNIAFTSLWDNYPDSISVPLHGRASCAYLLLAGTTNAMQWGVVNGTVRADYADGTSDTLILRNPDNWWPIEQDLDEDGLAFQLPSRPVRLSLQQAVASTNLAHDLGVMRLAAGADDPDGKQPALTIPGGAATMLRMPLCPQKKLRRLTLTTVANDVVIGLMGLTLQR